MATILITGASGFTGRYLAQTLRARGHRVAGLVGPATNRSVTGADPRGDSIACDLLDLDAVGQAISEVSPEVVIHLAAIALVSHSNVDAIYRTNIVGTRNLLEALSRMRTAPTHVMIASSANIYGNASEGTIDESVAPCPANDYSVSKLAMEHVARLWSQRLPITLVRPFNYTGVGQSESFLIPKIVAHFKRREPLIELGNLDVSRDFSDVRTVVDCYVRLLDVEPRFETYNVCSGVGHSLSAVLTMCSELSGHHLEVKVNPQFVRTGEVKTLVGSTARLESVIGKIDPIPLRETLRWMLDGH